ncbi:MAG: hypothetical protein GX256_01465 [Fretibacterium sp.]|nr:hypothetical protein [Fretibacterium sp.]
MLEIKEWTSSMSMEETKEIMEQVRELRRAGRKKEALEMSKRIPIDPELAEDIKRWDKDGFRVLVTKGFNLTDVVAKFGKEWLNV